MAKLVRRHTSNVEIIGSNPIGSNFFLRQVPPCNECIFYVLSGKTYSTDIFEKL